MVSTATVSDGGSGRVSVSVNGDPRYRARTTRTAVSMLLKDADAAFGRLDIEQEVQVPIGSGFGTSSASALSAVFAASSALGLGLGRRKLAGYAHAADIACGTGLGTVSVAYDSTGAGAITVPGGPGVARMVNVEVPSGLVVLTAALGPLGGRAAAMSRVGASRLSRLGDAALCAFLSDRRLECLGRGGEGFSEAAGLMTPRVRSLMDLAKSAGALCASQNMVGESVHALALAGDAERVAAAMKKVARVERYSLSARRAGPLD